MGWWSAAHCNCADSESSRLFLSPDTFDTRSSVVRWQDPYTFSSCCKSKSRKQNDECHRLLVPKHPLLPSLASIVSFEIAIGINGRIWLRSNTVNESIALKRVLEGVDDASVGQAQGEVERALKGYMV